MNSARGYNSLTVFNTNVNKHVEIAFAAKVSGSQCDMSLVLHRIKCDGVRPQLLREAIRGKTDRRAKLRR